MTRACVERRPINRAIPRIEWLETRTVPALLFANGTWVTGIGNGFGGANTSEVENTFVSYGFTASTPSYHVADDFTVPSTVKGWNLLRVDVYGYQTGAPADQNTFTKLHLKMYNGEPGAGGGVILDCSGANAIDVTGNAAFSNTYRVQTGDLQNNLRAVKKVKGNLCGAKRLAPGTYWLEWSVEGNSGYSPPRANVTVPWDAPDNGKQFNVSTGTWAPMIDPPSQGGNGKTQDIPFEIYGREIPPGIPPVDGRPPVRVSRAADPSPITHSNAMARQVEDVDATPKTAPAPVLPGAATMKHPTAERIDEMFAAIRMDDIE